jgi:hypothetical protein
MGSSMSGWNFYLLKLLVSWNGNWVSHFRKPSLPEGTSWFMVAVVTNSPSHPDTLQRVSPRTRATPRSAMRTGRGLQARRELRLTSWQRRALRMIAVTSWATVGTV